MKIRTRLKLNAWIYLGVVMLMIFSFVWSFREIYRHDQNENLAGEMQKSAFERDSLKNDYLLHREERARVQWYAKSETLRGLLESASERFTGKEEKALLKSARETFNATFSLFSRFLEKHKREEHVAVEKLGFTEADSRLIGQVFLNAHALQDSIGRLFESAERASRRTRDRGTFLIIFFVLGGGIAIIANSIVTSRVVAKRMAVLDKGIEIIGGGDLDYRIDIKGNDEFSELARAGNEMAVRLNESHTSVEYLKKEIAEREQAEEALHFTRFALDNAVETMVCLSKDARYIDVNDAFCRSVGYSREEILSMTAHDIDPNYSAKIWPEFWEKLKQSGSLTFESCHHTKDGKVFPVEVTVAFFEYKGKEYHCGFSRDITERRQAEELLRRTEENFRRSLDGSPLGVRIVTAGGETIYANRAILNIYGYDNIEELETTPIVKRYTPESFAGFKIRREKRKRGDDDPFEYDISIVRKDGEIRHLQVFRKETLWNGERQFQILYNDITERNRAEDALKAERQRLHDVLEAMPMMICLLTPDYHVPFSNRAFREKFGESQGRRCYEYCFGEKEPCDFCETYRVLKTAKPHHWQVTTPDGASVIDVHDFPFTDVDGLPLILEVNIDITERKQAEEILKASYQQLRALAGRLQSVREEQRKEFAREIHDELGGALTGLKIDLSFLASSAPKILDKTNRDFFLSKMLDMAKLIDETIGTVRRLAAELRPSILDDLGLLAALEWHFQEFQKRTGIQSEFVSTLEYINLDEELSIAVFRIFQESLTNVARHSGATKVTALLREEDGDLFLEIRDNGRGITGGEILDAKSLGILGMKERALVFG